MSETGTESLHAEAEPHPEPHLPVRKKKKRRRNSSERREQAAATFGALHEEHREQGRQLKAFKDRTTRLERELREEKARVVELEGALREATAGDEQAHSALTGPSPPLISVATNGRTVITEPTEHHPFSVGVMLPPTLATDPPGTSYKSGPFQFPHAVCEERNGGRLYIVESRIYCHVNAIVQNMVTGRRATEWDLSHNGNVTFRLDLIYADTKGRAHVDDFTSAPLSLFDPPESQVAVKAMVGGAVSWKVRLKCTSKATRSPAGRFFQFRVVCLNTDLSHLAALTYTVPAKFKVVTKRKSGK